MVTLASWCALRFGEAVELRRGDIDLSDEVIRVRRAAVRTKGSYSITRPKSDASTREGTRSKLSKHMRTSPLIS